MFDKFILLGSAPYIEGYWNQTKDYYLRNDYLILAVNNAWRVCYSNISEWFIADDFLNHSHRTGIKSGFINPTTSELENIQITPMPCGTVNGYIDGRGGIMTLNVMHILCNRYKNSKRKLQLVISGSDLIYKNGVQNHFYGTGTHIETVQKLLRENNPDYAGINADPLRFGNEWLKRELLHIQRRYDQAGYKILVDTPNKETRLPFKRIDKGMDI